MVVIELRALEASDREQFILDNQDAFRFGALEEFGVRDEHFEEPGEIISRKTIESCLDKECAVAYRIFADGRCCGGMILRIDSVSHRNELEVLFIRPEDHGYGIGQAAWHTVEGMFPDTEIWTTCTPYFEKRNIHFYVNRLGFSIVRFDHNRMSGKDGCDMLEMFYLEKRMLPKV